MKLTSIFIHSTEPWNKGKLIGQKAPLKLKEIWAIRIRLQLAQQTRNVAFFNLAIDSKLRGCDLLTLKVGDISQGRSILPRAVIIKKKARRPVQFEITEQTRASLTDWIRKAQLSSTKIYSQAEIPLLFIYRPGNMPESSNHGWNR